LGDGRGEKCRGVPETDRKNIRGIPLVLSITNTLLEEIRDEQLKTGVNVPRRRKGTPIRKKEIGHQLRTKSTNGVPDGSITQCTLDQNSHQEGGHKFPAFQGNREKGK